MKTKICSKCGIEKNISEYGIDNTRNDRYTHACKKCRCIQFKNYLLKNKEKHAKSYKNWYLKNKKKRAIYNKNYEIKNKNRLRKLKNLYYNNRIRIDINFKLASCLRKRIRNAINGISLHNSSLKLLGCSVEFVKNYLKSQFKPGMTWENYGYYGWHIDHIKPCASFNLSKKSEQRKCFNYSNLQPLWWYDNLSKGARY
jgi:hypothetical protein